MNLGAWVALGAGLVGLALLSVAAWVLWTTASERRLGALVGVDRTTADSPPLRSDRWRLTGRPDELRQLHDGAIVPVEWKRRASPSTGPYVSHRVQVWAYCLLVEETFGRPPPFGVVRYGDGVEHRVAWDHAARRQLMTLRRQIAQPYRGEATPSAGRCGGCAYRAGCDARAG